MSKRILVVEDQKHLLTILRDLLSACRYTVIDDATGVLARRGLSVLKAKRTIEAMLNHGEVRVHAPTVENVTILSRELKAVGVRRWRGPASEAPSLHRRKRHGNGRMRTRSHDFLVPSPTSRMSFFPFS